MTVIRFRGSWGAQRLKFPPDQVLPAVPEELKTAKFNGAAFLISDVRPDQPYYSREHEVKFQIAG